MKARGRVIRLRPLRRRPREVHASRITLAFHQGSGSPQQYLLQGGKQHRDREPAARHRRKTAVLRVRGAQPPARRLQPDRITPPAWLTALKLSLGGIIVFLLCRRRINPTFESAQSRCLCPCMLAKMPTSSQPRRSLGSAPRTLWCCCERRGGCGANELGKNSRKRARRAPGVVPPPPLLQPGPPRRLCMSGIEHLSVAGIPLASDPIAHGGEGAATPSVHGTRRPPPPSGLPHGWAGAQTNHGAPVRVAPCPEKRPKLARSTTPSRIAAARPNWPRRSTCRSKACPPGSPGARRLRSRSIWPPSSSLRLDGRKAAKTAPILTPADCGA
jgi:hypothetical protein